ncbi:unnamed protein product [Mytilus coruscus]|uniref:Apple domain-containing protein n=1 Tax=Mytilus coruscus TaxID=42192 RepID=A0A6J8E659_MYTCO|nr:unnamed protein product [Mytilus coruscus]
MELLYLFFVLNKLIHLETLRDNVALDKETRQSSLSASGYSHLANDGNKDQMLLKNGRFVCTQSQSDQPYYWWAVDLGKEYDVENINIFNRLDCCSHRLTDFYIYVYNPVIATWTTFDQGPGELCFFHKGQAPSVLSVACNNAHGRYVKIYKEFKLFSGYPWLSDNQDNLNLCEVEIFVDHDSRQGTYCKQSGKEPSLSFGINVEAASTTKCALSCRQKDNCLGFKWEASGTCYLFQTSKQVTDVISNIDYYERC